MLLLLRRSQLFYGYRYCVTRNDFEALLIILKVRTINENTSVDTRSVDFRFVPDLSRFVRFFCYQIRPGCCDAYNPGWYCGDSVVSSQARVVDTQAQRKMLLVGQTPGHSCLCYH